MRTAEGSEEVRESGVCERGMFPPSAYGLRPSASSSFFRLETSFLTFLVLLYYGMNQPLIYPFYTNRPRFV